MTGSDNKSRIGTLLAWLHRGEDIMLAGILTLTLGSAFGQIVLRNFFGTSIVWADTAIRILVLWLGMLGALIATRDKKHISIDLLSRFLSPRAQRIVAAVVSLFAGGVCAVAGYYSLLFVISEYRAGESAFAGVPAWLCETILPVAFLIIALRYTIQSILGIAQFRKAGPS